MSIPKRKRNRAAGGNGVDLDKELTPAQVCTYAIKQHGVHITENALALLRRDGKGPPYYKKGNRVLYTLRLIAPLIESRKPRLIDPAARQRGK